MRCRSSAQNPETVTGAITDADWKRLAAAGADAPESPLLRGLLEGSSDWMQDHALAAALRAPLLRVAAFYLTQAHRNSRPVDPVARFHLGNGARVERLNWLADTSARGLSQSWGIMVNYLYDPDRIEQNLEAFEHDGRVDASPAVRRMARQ